MAIRRVRPAKAPTRSRNHAARALPGRKLDHRRPRPRVSGPADPPVAVDAAALIRHRRDADVAGELSAIVEAAIEHLAREHGGEVLADTADAAEGSDLAAADVLWFGYPPPRHA